MVGQQEIKKQSISPFPNNIVCFNNIGMWHILDGVKKKLAIDGMQREHIPRKF